MHAPQACPLPKAHLLQLCKAARLGRCRRLLAPQLIAHSGQLFALSSQAALGQLGRLQVSLRTTTERGRVERL